MSLKMKMLVTCDEPGCEETFPFFATWGGVMSTADLRRAAPSAGADGEWQLPHFGDPSDTPIYCPRHRRPA